MWGFSTTITLFCFCFFLKIKVSIFICRGVKRMQLYSSFFHRRGCEQRFFHSCTLSPTLPQSHFWILDRFQRSLSTLFPFTNPTFLLLCKWVGISSSGSSFVSLPTLPFSLLLSTRSSIFHLLNYYYFFR